MKLIIFDVGNAFCSIISSPNGYGMMIDCGSNDDKCCPVDLIPSFKDWLGLIEFTTNTGAAYPLGLLHITHPDDDHVRNAKKVYALMQPYLLKKREFEHFPDGDTINSEYKIIDKKYRISNSDQIDWGFDTNLTFQIPIETLKGDRDLSKKLRNNSSIVRLIRHNGVSILYPGDLEIPAWKWLVENDHAFVNEIKNGIDILVAPHHGHNSGFPQCFFDKTGNVQMIVHSKGTEANIEGTDVSNQYSDNADGVMYQNLNNGETYFGRVFTTRSNGHIFITIDDNSFSTCTVKASSNHKRVRQ